MKKHPRVQRGNSPPIKLYGNDLRELASIVSAARTEIKIEADDNDLDDVSELTSFKQSRIQRFWIWANPGTAWVHLGPTSADFYVSGDSLADVGLFTSLVDFFFARRQGLLDGRYNYLLFSVVSNLASLGLVFLWVMRRAYFTLAGQLLIWLFVAVLPWLPVVAVHRVRVPHSLLFTRDKGDTPSFWSRNKDRILVDLIKVLAGVLLGGLAGYFLARK